MASLQPTLFPIVKTVRLTLAYTNAYCRLGHNEDHSCRQCLKRTLEAYGIDAEAFYEDARKHHAKLNSSAWRKKRKYTEEERTEHANRLRLRNYGITAQEYAALLAIQHGVCAICGMAENSTHRGRLRQLSVDHNHETGAVRGLLCARCNQGLYFIEKFGLLWGIQAQQYLLKYEQKPETID